MTIKRYHQLKYVETHSCVSASKVAQYNRCPVGLLRRENTSPYIINVNSTKSCRDAFLRLSKPPGLRKRQFHSAILLAETQECVSTR